MQTKWCASCHQPFQPPPQVPGQTYCSLVACQRERRRQWQLAKRKSDPDYRDNQSRAQSAWLVRQPGYWRRYRQSHPEYVARNRAQQSDRNNRRRKQTIAKMDVSALSFLLPSGIYRLSRQLAGVATIDEWIVQLTLLSDQNPRSANDCKEST